MSSNVMGALLMMASMLCFTANDVFVKLASGAVPLGQMMTLRGMLASVLIIGLALALRGLKLDLGRVAWQMIVLRSVTEAATAYFFLTALFNMPLANVTAILQCLPLTVALGAFVFFREPLGWRRLSAIGIGFCGMLLIVRPGAEGFSVWSLYALAAVACITARDLVTRRMPREIPSLTITVVNTVNVMMFFALYSLSETWKPVGLDTWWLLAGSSLFVIGGYFFSVQVMRAGDIAFIAPFRYTSLIAALTFGWAIFGDWPDDLTLIGTGIVVATGLFTLYRERQASR